MKKFNAHLLQGFKMTEKELKKPFQKFNSPSKSIEHKI